MQENEKAKIDKYLNVLLNSIKRLARMRGALIGLEDLWEWAKQTENTLTLNTIGESLFSDLISTSYRICWGNGKDIISLKTLIDYYQKHKDTYIAAAKEWPHDDSETVKQKFIEIENLIKEESFLKNLNKIKKYRDITLAHLMDKELSKDLLYKDVYNILDTIYLIGDNLNFCLKGNAGGGFKQLEKMFVAETKNVFCYQILKSRIIATQKSRGR